MHLLIFTQSALLLLLGLALTGAEPPSPNYIYSNYDSPYQQADDGYSGKGPSSHGGGDYTVTTEEEGPARPQYSSGGSPGTDDYGYTELSPDRPYKGQARPMTHSYSPPGPSQSSEYTYRPPPMPMSYRPKMSWRLPSIFRSRPKPSPPKPQYSPSSYSYSPMKPAYSSYGTLPSRPSKSKSQKPFSPSQPADAYMSYKPTASYKGYSPPAYPQHAPAQRPEPEAYGPPPKPSYSRPPPKEPTQPPKGYRYKGHMAPPPSYTSKAPPGYQSSSYGGPGSSHHAGGGGDEPNIRRYCRMWMSESRDHERPAPEESYGPQEEEAYGGGYDMGTSHY